MNNSKKSKAVPATLLAAFAATLVAGCGSSGYQTQVRRCVDDKGKVLPEEQCGNRRYGTGFYGYPRFVYGGSGSNTIGSTARGFVSSPDPNARVVSQHGQVVQRGGLGTRSSGRGGGFFGGFG